MSEPYAYDHFQATLLQEDRSFERGPKPGEPFEHFELPTTAGGSFRTREFVGKKPQFIYFASVT